MVGSNASCRRAAHCRAQRVCKLLDLGTLGLVELLDVDAVLDRGAVALRESFPTPCRWLAVPVAPVLGRRLGAHAASDRPRTGRIQPLCPIDGADVVACSLARLGSEGWGRSLRN